MTKYPVTPEENYQSICNEVNRLSEEILDNLNMTKKQYKNIVNRLKRLNEMLENYGKMIWGQ